MTGRRPAADAARLVRAALARRGARGRSSCWRSRCPGSWRWPTPRRRLPAALLRRREPRALRHRALQRPPAAVVLRPDHPRRAGAVVAADRAWRARGRPRRCAARAASPSRVAADPVGGGAGALLHAVGRPAAALHPAGAAAARLLVARTLVSRLAASEADGPARTSALARGGHARARSPCCALAVLLYRARPLLFALSPAPGQIGTAIIVVAGARPARRGRGSGASARCPRRSPRPRRRRCVTLQYTFYSARGHEPVQRMAKQILARARHGRAVGHLSRVRAQPGLLHRREAGRPRRRSRGRRVPAPAAARALRDAARAARRPAAEPRRASCTGWRGALLQPVGRPAAHAASSPTPSARSRRVVLVTNQP